ncbi:sensor domain-containing diguanylate cyclase [Thalassotalea sp. LPB0316]|uniref:GGDEF domain-containing protein n=1 Tax=Thalassotalea sp. LPB0316 TaxID=2769490 RepID=UPI001868243A|nr:sensor domain-containing diguanylate cyclase [Thalassotalea sp. LPB0316]QOL25447.1 sensor domain-containing diguanylate cyclase [Thalassotalea sp. LPB0316]
MRNPDIPDNELERLQALHALKILDTEPEERFDRLTRMARRLFNVPIALVSLVDEDRQWFKSCFGLPVKETGRDVSFCGHAILSDECLVIEDATKDSRFADNPLVLDEPCIRFYAGYPLKGINGVRLGTFCIIDDKPRTFSGNDLRDFEDLAVLAERELEAVQISTLDELTGITNRRGFNILAEFSFQMCHRMHLNLSLVYFDLDKFKAINDSYGHQEGDEVLIAFSCLLSKELRESDILARLGGDEFAVLFTGANIHQTKRTIERFQQALDTFNANSDKPYEIAFSYGMVSYNESQHNSIEALIDHADKQMYARKKKQAR